MDLTYATVPVFGGEQRRIYREAQLAYIISDSKDPTNHPIYARTTDAGSSILHTDNVVLFAENFQILKPAEKQIIHEGSQLWKMYFDGSCSKQESGVVIVLISPLKESSIFSFKLEFEATNNVAEYEALLIGLKTTKDMNISEISVFGDVELIIQQIRNFYQNKHPILRDYRNSV